MANPLKGETDFKVGKTTYRLILDINAICEVEAVTGIDLDEMLARHSQGISLRVLRGLLWGAMQRHHECTLDAVGEIILLAGIPAVQNAVSAALVAAMPVAEAAADENPPEQDRAGTGSKD